MDDFELIVKHIIAQVANYIFIRRLAGEKAYGRRKLKNSAIII